MAKIDKIKIPLCGSNSKFIIGLLTFSAEVRSFIS